VRKRVGEKRKERKRKRKETDKGVSGINWLATRLAAPEGEDGFVLKTRGMNGVEL
jgi:hypothetical protein